MPEIKAFLIADVRGYTRFTHEHGDEKAALLAQRFMDVARAGVEDGGGSVVDVRGDEIVAVFSSPRQAIRTALDLQARFAAETRADVTLPLEVGIGLDAGEAVPVGTGFRGGALNLAARLCSIAEPGEVLSSRPVAHLAGRIEGIDYTDRGEATFKGILEPVGVVRISSPATAAPPRAASAGDAQSLEFGILGPLEVRRGERALNLGGAKQRGVLAILLTHAGEVVSRDRLIDELWAGEPPPSAVSILQTYISHLRKALGPDVVQTRASGYEVAVDPQRFDLARFEGLLAEARDASAETAARLLREALALWRGPALADFQYEPFAQTEIARLEELRLAALERRIEADLTLGRQAELIGELEGLVGTHPLRERFQALLMLALYRAGRQAEALEAFQAARRTLVEELGLEPGLALQELERAILQHDPALAAGIAATPQATSSRADEPPAPVPERAILVAPQEEQNFGALLALAEPLARRPPRELILARLVSSPDDVPPATAALDERQKLLGAAGLAVRFAAFTSAEPGRDVVLIASEQPTDLVLLDAPPAFREDGTIEGELAIVLADAPCDVAVFLVREPIDRLEPQRPVAVPFTGADHDWSAIEIAAWISRALGASLCLVGTEADPTVGRRDASRLLARASLMVQQVVGISTQPLLVAPESGALLEAADDACLLVVGLSPRWRQEGLGEVRLAIAREAGPPTLFVRRGLRPGGLAPQQSVTRFTWTLQSQDT